MGRTALPFLADIYQEHLDEAEFLWGQWSAAQSSPTLSTADLAAGTEDRLLAHIDGLVVGAQAAARAVLWPALEDPDVEPARLGAAALALLNGPDPEVIDRLVALAGETTVEGRAALERAFTAAERAPLTERLTALLPEATPPVAACLARALTARGAAPGPWQFALFNRSDAEVVAARLGPRLLRVAPGQRDVIEWALAHAAPSVRDAAIEAGLIGGLAAAWNACKAAAMERPVRSPRSLVLVAQGGTQRELSALIEGLHVSAARPLILWALGTSGRVTAAEACLPWLTDEVFGRLAAEAFSAITGLCITGPFALPAEAEAAVDSDADLRPQPDDALPRPAPDAIVAWWKENAARFNPRLRYLTGVPIDASVVRAALVGGPLRRACALATEVVIRGRGTIALGPMRWASDRIREAAAVTLDAETLSRPFEHFLEA